MSEGLATYLSNPCEEGLVKALGAAKAVLKDRVPTNSEEWSPDGLQTLVERGITAAAETTLAEMLKTEKVVGSEVSIGSGRIDLVTTPRNPISHVINAAGKPASEPFAGAFEAHGDYLIITDHKTSIQKAPRYIESDFKDIPLNWQLWDYAWRAQQYYGRPVRWIRIHQIILSPRTKCIMSEPSRIKPENLEAWAVNAERHWSYMAADDHVGLAFLPQNWHHCLNKYGPCRAYQACHSFLRDEKQMESVYVRKEKR
ncbi:hypothetical protein LCGC14_0474250 [marine sediment metagenome]|uniref:PD-(D/E)XK endonuclease-like domain-containing protein n=1 Tax=marine sediment metagenome TaxID=412755 RepID=A0A0F9SB66_9ZZZZ